MGLAALAVSLNSAPAFSSELESAYQKEYAFLVAEKKALEQRLRNIKNRQNTELDDLDTEIETLQQNFLVQQNQVDRLNNQIVEASRNVDFAENDGLLLDTTLIQARESLLKTGSPLPDSGSEEVQLNAAFALASQILQGDGEVRSSDGNFFLEAGEESAGRVVHVGRIARFGVSEAAAGALAPAGSGLFRVWDNRSANTAQQLLNGADPAQIDVFLFDNIEKGIEKKAQRGIEDDVEAGGLIAKVIVGIGAVGVLLVLIRMLFLVLFSADVQKITRKVNEKVSASGGNVEEALKVCHKGTSSACRVVSATLRNLDKDRDHIEDIVSESILHESSRIDRFGAAILVIAAISPLLGLLGTVTGMISTFDIITEFGTGDPKLLSSGISEALITTKFGLIVAIPMLLLGNILSSWATRIKLELEQAALNMINTHKV